MNCEQFKNLVHDLVKGEPLGADTVEASLTHAEGCPACDLLMEEAESLNVGIHALGARYASAQPEARVERTILAAFDRKFGQPHLPTVRHSLRGSWLMSVAGVAAAAILFVSLTYHGVVAAPVRPAAPQTTSAADPAYELESEVPTEASEADSFTSLSPSFDAQSLDEDAVVRVVLSDAALESFGLPANETGRGQVIADLVVASDGVPQAIRVVGW